MAEKSDTANELVRVQENTMIEAQQNERQTDDLIGFGVS